MKTVRISANTIFLIDATGAALSSLLLGVVLPYFSAYFNMPIIALYWLASIAFLFCLYALLCHLASPINWNSYLKAIAFGNLTYLTLTIILCIYYFNLLSLFDCFYFIGESIILILLIRKELRLVEW